MPNKIKLYLASDHAGYALKTNIIRNIDSEKFLIIDLGPDEDISVDYPDFANKLAQSLKDNSNAFGILICSSGIGMSIAANRYLHIRAALCKELEDVEFARKHNEANVLVLAAKYIEFNAAICYIEKFTMTKFDGGRHQLRVAKLNQQGEQNE